MKKFVQTFTMLLLAGFLQACVTAPSGPNPLDLSAYQTAHLDFSRSTSARPVEAKWINADVRQELKNRRSTEFVVPDGENAEITVRVALLQVRGPYKRGAPGSPISIESRVKATVEVIDTGTDSVLGSEEFTGISRGNATNCCLPGNSGDMRAAVKEVSILIGDYLAGTPSAPAEVEGHATSAPSPGD